MKSILITSANESEGKTTTSSNLAWALAAVGSRVVLADIDFRRPKVHPVYGLAREPGFFHHLVDRIPLHELVAHVEDDERTWPCCRPALTPHSPGDFLASQISSRRCAGSSPSRRRGARRPTSPAGLGHARHRPPCRSNHPDHPSAGSTTVEQLQTAVESLRAAGASIAGVVLVGGKQDRSYGTYTPSSKRLGEPGAHAESRKTSGTGRRRGHPRRRAVSLLAHDHVTKGKTIVYGQWVNVTHSGAAPCLTVPI
ncbi:MAG: hypothetical protein R2710_27975 [Acidimicrobiales bacterium]